MSLPASKITQQVSQQKELVEQTLEIINKKDLNKLSESDLNAHLMVLIKNKKNKLDFSQAEFGLLEYQPKTLQAILKFIAPPYETITHVDFSENEIHELDSSQFKVLTEALAISNIKILNLSGNKIFEMESVPLRNFFYQILKNKNLGELDLTDVNLDEVENVEDLAYIFELLSRHQNLRVLKLCANGIGALTQERITAIFKPIAKSKLIELDLTDNDLDKLTDDDVNTVFSSIRASNILYLAMQDNKLSNMESPLLLTMLSHIETSQIRSLGLEGNNLETNECFLSKAATNHKLTEFKLVYPIHNTPLLNGPFPSQLTQRASQVSSELPAAMVLADKDIGPASKHASSHSKLSSEINAEKAKAMSVECQKDKLNLKNKNSNAAAASATPLLKQYDLRRKAAQIKAEDIKAESSNKAKRVKRGTYKKDSFLLK